jgi:hypothetical protein
VTQYSRQTREDEDQVGSKDGSFVLFVSAIFFVANLTFKLTRNFGFFILSHMKMLYQLQGLCNITGCSGFFKKILGHFKILGAIFVISSNSHTEDTRILGANVKILFSRANWRPDFVFPW